MLATKQVSIFVTIYLVKMLKSESLQITYKIFTLSLCDFNLQKNKKIKTSSAWKRIEVFNFHRQFKHVTVTV
jgi:hypothetical protein